MIIYSDTREQLELDFSMQIKKGKVDKIVDKALPFADYWAAPSEGSNEFPLCFERKSIGDLYGTMGKGYVRFKKMLGKAKKVDMQVVLIIEGSIRDISEGYQFSKVKGESMLKKLFMLWCRYDLIPVFCNDRHEMVRFITEAFWAIDRNYREGK